MATVEVLLSKSSEACQWMVQYLVGPEGREITRSGFCFCLDSFVLLFFYYYFPASHPHTSSLLTRIFKTLQDRMITTSICLHLCIL